jgi:hypothetical protein
VSHYTARTFYQPFDAVAAALVARLSERGFDLLTGRAVDDQVYSSLLTVAVSQGGM